jgi:hypothetical protein
VSLCGGGDWSRACDSCWFSSNLGIDGRGLQARLVTEGGQTGAVSLVDGRGDDGSVREGLRQCNDGGEQSQGFRLEFDEIEDQLGDYLYGKLTRTYPTSTPLHLAHLIRVSLSDVSKILIGYS